MSASDAATKHFGALRPPRMEWISLAEPEDAIDPGLPIIDAHHHLWDVRGAFDNKLGGLDHRYLIDEFATEIADSGHNVIGSIYIEAHHMFRIDGPEALRSVGEVEFANGMAAMSASGRYGPARLCSGIVGYADLRLGREAEPVLKALKSASSERLRGVRFRAAWDPDPTVRPNAGVTGPGLYRDPRVKEAIGCLASLGLSLDCQLFHPQLGDLLALAQALPDTQFIIGHIGGLLGTGRHAERKNENFADWKAALRALAACPNVSIKIGGLTLRLAAFDFHALPRPLHSEEVAELWRPYVETCIEVFGANRCMFESNFPVDKQGLPYVSLINAIKRITSQASSEEKQAIFAGTARKVYRLAI